MIGQTLGNYRIISEIGKGGMGVVYQAEHTLIGKKAAVKLLRADVPEDQVERFFNEAKAAATLQHPGLVDVVDFGHSKEGRAFIVMELLSGESLAERLERDPRLPVPIACTIARLVANALAVAHRGGIVHRDLKPGNIFLIPDAESPAGVRTKVLDFGIAKLQRNRDDKAAQTHSGAVIGTPRYMSPEQCKNAREVDGRADIYSLGCILFEMLLGVAPFDYDSWAELVSAHLKETPPKPSELDPAIPKDVETLMMKMLSKRPQDRHGSMEDLAQSIEVILREHASDWPVRATPASGIRRVSKQHLDETLPASSDRLTPVNLKAAIDDTLPPTPPPGTLRTPSKPGTDDTAPGSSTPPRPTPQPEAAPAPISVSQPAPAKKPPWLAIGLGAGGAIALVAALVLVLANKGSKEPDEKAYIIVKEGGSATQSSAGSAAVDTPPPVTQDAAVAQVLTDAGAKTTKPTGTDVGALTRTFNKQTSAVAACFRAHPNDASKEDMSIRIQIDTQGKVTKAEVLPASVSTTPLGQCLDGVARATEFGPQPKPAAFRVPILTK
ncbi:MAG TPA: protein kinase [Kofleriaceae bacterium]|nr:protein kinase [Kofleriaceae bacterium]